MAGAAFGEMCVWRRYCEQDLQGLLCCFCVIGGGVLLLHHENLSPKHHNIMRKKMVDIVARGLMFHLFFI